MAWGAIPSGVNFTETTPDKEAPPNSYLRLKQTRKHLRTNFDPSISQITRTLYDNAVAAGDKPVYIDVKDVGTDPMWRTLEVDVITFHTSGTMLIDWALIILAGAIISYFLIQSIYLVATGPGGMPISGYQTVTDPNTGDNVIVPQGSYFEYDPASGKYILQYHEATDINSLMQMAIFGMLGLGGIYVLTKVIK